MTSRDPDHDDPERTAGAAGAAPDLGDAPAPAQPPQAPRRSFFDFAAERHPDARRRDRTDEAVLRAQATIGLFAVIMWIASPSDREVRLSDVAAVGVLFALPVALATFFDRTGPRVLFSAATVITAIVFARAGVFPAVP